MSTPGPMRYRITCECGYSYEVWSVSGCQVATKLHRASCEVAGRWFG